MELTWLNTYCPIKCWIFISLNRVLEYWNMSWKSQISVTKRILTVMPFTLQKEAHIFRRNHSLNWFINTLKIRQTHKCPCNANNITQNTDRIKSLRVNSDIIRVLKRLCNYMNQPCRNWSFYLWPAKKWQRVSCMTLVFWNHRCYKTA